MEDKKVEKSDKLTKIELLEKELEKEAKMEEELVNSIDVVEGEVVISIKNNKLIVNLQSQIAEAEIRRDNLREALKNTEKKLEKVSKLYPNVDLKKLEEELESVFEESNKIKENIDKAERLLINKNNEIARVKDLERKITNQKDNNSKLKTRLAHARQRIIED